MSASSANEEQNVLCNATAPNVDERQKQRRTERRKNNMREFPFKHICFESTYALDRLTAITAVRNRHCKRAHVCAPRAHVCVFLSFSSFPFSLLHAFCGRCFYAVKIHFTSNARRYVAMRCGHAKRIYLRNRFPLAIAAAKHINGRQRVLFSSSSAYRTRCQAKRARTAAAAAAPDRLPNSNSATRGKLYEILICNINCRLICE